MCEELTDDEKLIYAVQTGNLNNVQQLLERGVDPNKFDIISKTPLHYAAEEENFEIVKLLLANGADVNAHETAKIGDTPIASVAQTCSLEMANLLLTAGANPLIPGWMQLNALHRAERRRRGDGPKVYQLLRKHAGLD